MCRVSALTRAAGVPGQVCFGGLEASGENNRLEVCPCDPCTLGPLPCVGDVCVSEVSEARPPSVILLGVERPEAPKSTVGFRLAPNRRAALATRPMTRNLEAAEALPVLVAGVLSCGSLMTVDYMAL